MGKRGCAFGVAHDRYRGGDVSEKINFINANTLVIAQIENVEGLENADAIAATPGIDGLWVGQFDLSASLGILEDLKMKESSRPSRWCKELVRKMESS